VFDGRIRHSTLALICRKVGTMLEAGVAVRRVFKVAAGGATEPKAREALDEIDRAVQRGDDVTTGMRRMGGAFPPLMIDMVEVGEQTGALPEILKSLASHYENLVRLRKNFLSQIMWPMIQLFAAIFVIAFLVLLTGMIAEGTGTNPLPILPFGLTGATGAVVWLVLCFGTLGGLFFGYVLVSRSLRGRQVLDPLLMRIPKVGTCMQSFAVARFAWAFSLTQNAGMGIKESLQASLNATSNGAFTAAYPQVWQDVREGESLADALTRTRLFPEEMLETVRAAEHSGTVPEMLAHMSPTYEEDARRSLAQLTTLLGWVIWLLIATFIIFLIFRVAMIYLGMLNDAVNQVR
jgi:type IV pilus assembly protein PilC